MCWKTLPSYNLVGICTPNTRPVFKLKRVVSVENYDIHVKGPFDQEQLKGWWPLEHKYNSCIFIDQNGMVLVSSAVPQLKAENAGIKEFFLHLNVGELSHCLEKQLKSKAKPNLSRTTVNRGKHIFQTPKKRKKRGLSLAAVWAVRHFYFDFVSYEI